ncbi:hypothetical protein LCGC14_2773530, partial [marine sediment metagenome]
MGVTINRPRLDLDLMPPIGSVLAWMKSFPNTPALPSGWVECNGQVLDDAASVYDGETIPNLNVADRFLRGNSTSGGTGGATSININHRHTIAEHNHSVSDTRNTGSGSAHSHDYSGRTDVSDSTMLYDRAADSQSHRTTIHTHAYSGGTNNESSHYHLHSISASTT